MDFYTNVTPHGDFLHIRGFQNGERFSERIKYQPRLYFPFKGQCTHNSLDGKGLMPKSYNTIREARSAIKRYEEHKNFVYGTDRFQYQFISDKYSGTVEYDKDKLRIYTIDIEVESEHGFPNVEDHAEKMICITIKDQVKKQILVWGLADYKPKQDNVHYIKCIDEKDLLIKFIKFWKEYTPDIITGWNSKYFDIPYLVRRIDKILGETVKNKMSPWGQVM